MQKFINGNEWYWRLARTLVEVIIAFVIANAANILSGFGMDAGVVSALTAGITAVLSPVLAALKKHDSEGIEVSNG